MNEKNKRIKLHTINIVILLIFCVTAGSIGVGYLVQNNPLLKSFDDFFYVLINKGPHFKILDLLIVPFNFNFLPDYLSPFHMPSYFYFMILGTLGYTFIKKREMWKWVVFCLFFGTVLSQITTALDWHFVFRQRPFVFLPNNVSEIGKQAWTNWTSFPSGHVRDTTLYAVLIYHFFPKLKGLMIFFIFFISFSRIYLGAHYPTDVIAGLIIGYISAKIVLIIARELALIKKGGASERKLKTITS